MKHIISNKKDDNHIIIHEPEKGSKNVCLEITKKSFGRTSKQEFHLTPKDLHGFIITLSSVQAKNIR